MATPRIKAKIERTADLFERLPDSLLLEVLNRVGDARTLVRLRSLCRKARVLTGLVETLEVELPAAAGQALEKAECRLLSTVAFCSRIKHLTLVLRNGQLSRLCLLSLLERVKGTLVSFELRVNFYSYYNLPGNELLSLLAQAQNLQSLALVKVNLTGELLSWPIAQHYKLVALKHLRLSQVVASARELEMLLKLVPSVEDLQVDKLQNENSPNDLGKLSFSWVPNLKRLRMSAFSKSQPPIELRFGAEGAPRGGLTHLDLSTTGASFFGFWDIEHILQENTGLQCLRLPPDDMAHVSNNAHADRIVTLLINLQSLQHLEILEEGLLKSLARLQENAVASPSGGPLPMLRKLILPVPFALKNLERFIDFLHSLKKLEYLGLKPLAQHKPESGSAYRSALKKSLEVALYLQRNLPWIDVQAEDPDSSRHE